MVVLLEREEVAGGIAGHVGTSPMGLGGTIASCENEGSVSGGVATGNIIGDANEGYLYGVGSNLTSQLGNKTSYFIVVNGELPNYNDLYNNI